MAALRFFVLPGDPRLGSPWSVIDRLYGRVVAGYDHPGLAHWRAAILNNAAGR